MSIEYTLAAHPTTYAGVMFRSRLEARWAALFDLLGVDWAYEPFDLPGWSPDFELTFEPSSPATDARPLRALCEVKPISAPIPEIESRIAFAATRGAFDQTHHVLLLGLRPWKSAKYGGLKIGWMCFQKPADRRTKDEYAFGKVDKSLGLWMVSDSGLCRHLPLSGLDKSVSPPLDAEDAWRQAGERVRWKGPSR